MSIYIIFIIFGILYFYLINNINKFNISNQFKLLYQGPDLVEVDPNQILKDMFDRITNNESVCALDGFGDCELLMREFGGSCQINSIVGFYRALGIPFQQADREYINSFRTDLAHIDNYILVYNYLNNRPSVIGLKRIYNINGNGLLENDMINLKNNVLYPLRVRGFAGPGFSNPDGTPKFIMAMRNRSGNLITEDHPTGHILLMYKTNYNGLVSFIHYIEQNFEILDVNASQSRDKDRILADLRSVVDSVRSSGVSDEDRHKLIRDELICCIMIDLCQKQFYAVTDFDYPYTLPASHLSEDIIKVDYNRKWRMKLGLAYLKHLGIVAIRYEYESSNYNLIMSELNTDDDDIIERIGEDRGRRIIDGRNFLENLEDFQNLFTISFISYDTFDNSCGTSI
jgi:hypothetical protein